MNDLKSVVPCHYNIAMFCLPSFLKEISEGRLYVPHHFLQFLAGAFVFVYFDLRNREEDIIWNVLCYVISIVQCFVFHLSLKRLVKAVLIYLVISYSYSLAAFLFVYFDIRNREGYIIWNVLCHVFAFVEFSVCHLSLKRLVKAVLIYLVISYSYSLAAILFVYFDIRNREGHIIWNVLYHVFAIVQFSVCLLSLKRLVKAVLIYLVISYSYSLAAFVFVYFDIRSRESDIIWKVLCPVTVQGFAWRLFLKRLARAFLIYLVISYSYSLAVILYLYLVIRNREGGDLFWRKHDSRTALEVILPTVIRFFPLVVYSLPLPITVLLIAVWTYLGCLDSLLDAREEELLREANGHSYQRYWGWQDITWINEVLQLLWPYFKSFALSRAKVLIREQGLEIIDLTLKTKAPRVSSIKVTRRGYQVLIDVNITYKDDISLCVTYGIWPVEITAIEIVADVVIELRDFMPDVPFLGKAVVHMIKLPTITRESNWVDRWCNTGVERKFMDMFPIIIHSAKHYYNDIESLRDHQVPTRDQPELQWLNMILLGFWPSVKDYIEGLVSDHRRDLNPRFQIKRIDLGYPGLEVASVDFRREYVGGEKRTFLDVKIMYNGGCSSRIQWNPGFEFEVSNIMVQAVLNIELMNLVGFPPFVQKVVVHMEKDPIIDAEFSEIAHFNITPIKKYVMYFIRRKVKSYFPITQHLGSGLRF